MKVFYADTHLYGINSVDIIFNFSEDVYLLGDIVDLRNCSHNRLFEAQETHASILKKLGERYISGNHELDFENLFLVVDGIYMTHGDYLCWGKKKAVHFRKERKGRSNIERLFSKIWDYVYRMLPIIVNKKLCERAYAEATRNSCHTVILGHMHPRKLISIIYRGITIYILPQGRTELSL